VSSNNTGESAGPRSTFDLVLKVGSLLVVIVTLSEKAPVALAVLIAAAVAVAVRKCRRNQ
jgi:hypothetical protein